MNESSPTLTSRIPRGAEQAAEIIGAVREGDRRGHVVHTCLAALYLFTLPLQTAPKDVAFAALILCALIRIGETARTYRFIVNDRVGMLLTAWAAWTALSLAWSPDLVHGLAELKVMRFLLTAFVLWPVLEHVGLLLAAFLAGVLVQQGLQVVQSQSWLGLRPDSNGRLGGITHPIVMGVLCAMAMCWHLAALLTSRGVVRWGSLACFAAAGAGLVATGSRGPWIAAAVSVPATLLVTGWRRPRARRPAIVLVILLIIAGAAAWPVAGPVITSRVQQTLDDLDAAGAGDDDTDVGFRLLSWRIGRDTFRAAPLWGGGVGSFHVESDKVSYDAGHAHSVYVHVGACTGAIGLLLFLSVLGLNVRRGLMSRPDYLWADGTPFALLAWMVAAAFDTFHVSGQMFGVLLVLLTIVIPRRPPNRFGWTNPLADSMASPAASSTTRPAGSPAARPTAKAPDPPADPPVRTPA